MKTDWINSKPVFYNTKTLKTSDNMLSVWDGGFDNEGLYDFLTFGYQVFEQTALKDVKKLRHSSEIKDGKIIEYPDPIEKYIGKVSSVDESLSTLETHILRFELSHKSKMAILLSGGYDSRFLAHFIKHKWYLDAYTCDVSIGNKYSAEMIRAKEVCKRLGIRHYALDVKNYYSGSKEVFDNFGLEVNAGAAIALEMPRLLNHNGIILHGSVGDWWRTQKVKINPPKDYLDFSSLFFTHGVSIPKEFIKVKTNHENKQQEYETNIKRLREDELFRIVYSRRGRIGVASMGMRGIEKYSKAYTPFYDIDVAMSQLNLPTKDRWGSWAKDYFKKVGLDVDDIRYSHDWNQDLRVAYNSLDSSLDVKKLSSIVDKNRLEWINAQLSRIKKLPVPMIGKTSNALHHIGAGRYFDYGYKILINNKDIIKALGEWNILKVVEYAI